MFNDPITSDALAAYPADSGFSPSDWMTLARFWHPVAFAHDVAGGPVAARLLDIDLVVFRTRAGITVARDRCPHRSVKLSLGAVDNDVLICPMHGNRFRADGRCQRIPSISDPNAPISPRMRLDVYRCEVRYGIVWVCLDGEPIWNLPIWPGIDNPAYEKVFVPVDDWQCSAPRHTENFNDQAHFPFVHRQSFGSDKDLAAHDYSVEETDYGLRFVYDYVESGNRFPDRVEADERPVSYTYELTFPFSTLLYVSPKDSDFVHYFADAVCPVSAGQTRLFQLLTDSTGTPDRDYWIADSLQILREDKPLVESQPAVVPVAGDAELHHLPADRWSLKYREHLRDRFGLGRL